jgi:DNA-binding PadR family transcriptional regulator
MPTRRGETPDPESFLPLPPMTFHILLALQGDERHGYAIMKEVAEQTRNDVRLGPGTLYGTLKRLREAGLVEEAGERVDADDERRRYYRLTRLGIAVARADARRMEAMVQAAQRKRLLSARA